MQTMDRVEACLAALAEDGSVGLRDRSVAVALLTTWIDLVASYNEKIDLTAARSPDELVDLMVADAAVLAQRIPQGSSVVDVGTGAGAPGLPLAVLRPDLEVTLVEPLDKRVSFLRNAIGRTLGALTPKPALPRVTRGRGEDVVTKGATFDVAVSRATLPPEAWLALAAELAPDGQAWILLAQAEPPTREAWWIVHDVPYAWPLTGATRRAIAMHRR